jgi:CHAT domain-containing protein/tetratricopeptide (TPR) repeat protein
MNHNKQLLFLGWMFFILCAIRMGNAQPGNLSGQILQLVDSADWYRNNGRIQASIQRLQQGLALSQTAPDSVAAIVAHKLAVNYFYTDSFPKALAFVGDAIDVREKVLPRGHVDIANSRYLRALIYRYSGQGARGMEDLEAAVDQIEANEAIPQTEKASRLSSYYAEWGILLATRGDYYQALFCWDQAEKHLRTYLQGKELEGRLAYLSELRGTVAHDLGNYEEAVEAYEKTLSWQEKQADPSAKALASLYNNLGLTYQERGQNRRSVMLFEKALALFQSQEERSGVLNVYPNLIKAYGTLGDYSKARQSLQAGLELCEQVYGTPYHPLAAKMRYYLAETLLNSSQEDFFRQQLQTALHLLSPDCSADNWEDLPDIQDGRATNATELTRPLYLKAVYLYNKSQGTASTSKITLLQQAIQVFEALDQLISRNRQTFKVAASKFHLQQLWINAYEQATLACLDLYAATADEQHLHRAFQLANKNKAIVLLEGIKNLDNKKLAGIPDSLIALEEELLNQYYQTETAWYEATELPDTTSRQEVKNRLLNLKTRLDRLSSRMEKEFPAYYELKHRPLEPAAPPQLEEHLDSESALVEYFVGQNYIFIFFLTTEGLSFRKIDKPDHLNRMIETFRTLTSQFGLTEAQQNRMQQLGYQLYELLLKEGLEQLPEEVSHLIIVPDDVLLSLSFEVLNRTNNGLNYLLRQYRISYLYANQLLTRPFDQQRIRWTQKRFLGFGLEYDENILKLLKDIDTTGNRRGLNLRLRNLGQLEYSDDEVLAIQGLLQGKAFINEEATKSNFFKNLTNSNLLHMAMHGLVDLEHPLRSALVFAPEEPDKDDYLLYAGDIYGLQLPNNRMVMLSACNTGFGKLYAGEGIRSLSRAFMYAGAPSVVASLWSAPDQSTRDITVDYYKYLKKGLPKSEALQQAKIDFLENASPTYRHPAYWAHLIVIGDDQALFENPSNKRWWWAGLGILILFAGWALFLKRNKN